MFAFHSITTLGAVLMVVFAAGLFRRLRARRCRTASLRWSRSSGSPAPPSCRPGRRPRHRVRDAVHRGRRSSSTTRRRRCTTTGSAPSRGCGPSPAWPASRSSWPSAAVRSPRWIGLVGLVLGGLTVLLGVSPLEYMAGMTGALWLLVTAIGFTVGDRAFRRRSMNATPRHARSARSPVDRAGLAASRTNVPVTATRDRPPLGGPGPPAGLRRPARADRRAGRRAPRRRDPASSSRPGYGWPYAAIGLVFGLCCAVVLLHDRRQGFGWALGWHRRLLGPRRAVPVLRPLRRPRRRASCRA